VLCEWRQGRCWHDRRARAGWPKWDAAAGRVRSVDGCFLQRMKTPVGRVQSPPQGAHPAERGTRKEAAPTCVGLPVVVHEMLHLIAPTHDAQFLALLAALPEMARGQGETQWASAGRNSLARVAGADGQEPAELDQLRQSTPLPHPEPIAGLSPAAPHTPASHAPPPRPPCRPPPSGAPYCAARGSALP
jgi:hypothetical protein